MDAWMDNLGVGLILAASAAQLVLGTVFGWLLRGARMGRPSAESVEQQLQARRLGEAMQQLRQLTGAIGQNVGQHADRVASIEQGLQKARDENPGNVQEAILLAMSEMTAANERLQGELKSAEDRLQQQATQLEAQMAQARTDALTGLVNRRGFDDELSRRVAEYLRYQSPVALMLADVDHFKRFNDTHGHLAGDEVLRGVARVLRDAMREVDIVCRYGGEEFAVIFPATRAADVIIATERARKAIEAAAFNFEGRELHVTISEGIAEALPSDNLASLIKRADEALYASKKAGRNRGHLHTGGEIQAVGEAAVRVEAPVAETQAPAEEIEQPLLSMKPQERTDDLTGLPNQQLFREDLRRRLAQRRRYGTPVSLVMADVNSLETINQAHGRDVGDMVLRAVAQFFSAALREMDLVARFDQDTFALLMPGSVRANAVRAAERIRGAIEHCKLKLPDGEVRFSVSMGVAEASPDEEIESLQARAMAAVVAAKSGPSVTHVHDGHAALAVDPQPVESHLSTSGA
jgi:diguanylate cyclase